jgi:hypothetical protein
MKAPVRTGLIVGGAALADGRRGHEAPRARPRMRARGEGRILCCGRMLFSAL